MCSCRFGRCLESSSQRRKVVVVRFVYGKIEVSGPQYDNEQLGLCLSLVCSVVSVSWSFLVGVDHDDVHVQQEVKPNYQQLQVQRNPASEDEQKQIQETGPRSRKQESNSFSSSRLVDVKKTTSAKNYASSSSRPRRDHMINPAAPAGAAVFLADEKERSKDELRAAQEDQDFYLAVVKKNTNTL
ncbi:unnamed protein product [Amoebophrya sp. A120]|nr:unnamed protein product [Amoebophrya sp. A120]|eukprot:GSA120T00000969001.1